MSPTGEQASADGSSLCGLHAVDSGAAAGVGQLALLRQSVGSSGSDAFASGLGGHVVHSRSPSVGSCSLSAASTLGVDDVAPNALVGAGAENAYACAGGLLIEDGPKPQPDALGSVGDHIPVPVQVRVRSGSRNANGRRSDVVDAQAQADEKLTDRHEQSKKLVAGAQIATQAGPECKRSRFESGGGGNAPAASSPTRNANTNSNSYSAATQMPYSAPNRSSFCEHSEQSPPRLPLPYATNTANNNIGGGHGAGHYPNPNAGQSRFQQWSSERAPSQEHTHGAFAGRHEPRDSARMNHRAGNGSAVSKLDPNVVYSMNCCFINYYNTL